MVARVRSAARPAAHAWLPPLDWLQWKMVGAVCLMWPAFTCLLCSGLLRLQWNCKHSSNST